MAARIRRLETQLQEVDTALADSPPPPSLGREVSGADVIVTIGTSALVEQVADVVRRIEEVVNQAYTYRRVSRADVRDRLAMGDAGLRANRVLHLAWRGDELLGACSSTYQPPWTPEGCGHWGLLSVIPEAQSTGVASALVRAAELRLAAACEMIQIEYEYTPGDEYSGRLLQWYEGKCGFECPSGPPRNDRRYTQFRKCFKRVGPELSAAGRHAHLTAMRAHIEREKGRLEAEAEAEGGGGGDACEGALVGRSVMVCGLRSARQHNKSGGVVVSWDAARGRYAVRLACGEHLLLKEENLECDEEGGEEGDEESDEEGDEESEEESEEESAKPE